jgi:hypothetical protein
MRTRWNAKRFIGVAAICVSVATAAVGSVPSTAFAFGDGNTSGGVTNGGTTTGGGTSSAGSTTTASGRNTSRFYDAGINGTTCTGVGGTVGGSHGTARSRVGTPSTVSIRVSRLTPAATYRVSFFDSACSRHVLGTFVTNAHGRGSGTYTFSATPYTGIGSFFLDNLGGTDIFQTTGINF